MWKRALFLSLYLMASMQDGHAKGLPKTFPTTVGTQVEAFLKCSARTTKAHIRDSYCNTKLHFPSNVIPEMRRCLAKKKISATELPSFVIPNEKSFQVQFACTGGSSFSIHVENPQSGAWIEGIYQTMP
jgi:hypothetical protein